VTLVWFRRALTQEMLAEARFVEARVHAWTGYRTSTCT
jgi:hypothetical protein